MAPEILVRQILPFLTIANQQNEKVVVHCSGGIGRTGHILAAWLVAGRGFSSKSAISAVKQTGRNPYEPVIAAPSKGFLAARIPNPRLRNWGRESGAWETSLIDAKISSRNSALGNRS
ncbi:MAG: dual specificity protein phosphatase family protein [Cyanosarcina radialis HA8281-LM2]|nr:dual specificity protein phosphatase family protein [Cyanosarcina radialis HA8281-LM2]